MSGKQRAARPAFRLEINWKITAFAVFFLPILVSLGFWQLNRAEQKRMIQESVEAQQAKPPFDWQMRGDGADPGEQWQYRRVRVSGQFDTERSYLIENKIHNGRPGYHVLTPFYPQEGGALLVNRGWIPGTGYRERLPEFATPAEPAQVTGVLVVPNTNRLLANQTQVAGDWPRVRLSVTPEVAETELARPFADQVLQLDPESTGAYTVDWQPVNMSPRQHIGYAVQWFSLALALVILTVFANSNLASVIKRRSE